MSRYGKLGKNFGLLTIGSFASSILSFLFTPLYTSVLTTAEYGIADLISVTISLSYPILTLVISEAIMRFCLDAVNDKKQIFSIGFYICGLGCIVMLCLSPILKITPLNDYQGYFIAYFVVQVFYTALGQFIKGSEDVGHYALGGLLNSATVIFLNILFLVVIKIGLRGYLLSLILGHLVALLYFITSSKAWKKLLPFSKVDKTLRNEMLAYSCPMILNSVSWWISNSSDKYILTYFCGVSENGIYSVAYKIPNILSIITSLFISAWQISAVEDFNSDESKAFFKSVGNKYIALNIIISGWLVAFSRILATILYANDYYEAWHISPILIAAYAFSTMSSFYGTIYTSAKRTKMLLYSTLLGAGLNIVLNIILIPNFGGTGAAFATFISYMIIWVIRVVDSRKIMVLDLDRKKIIPGFAVVAIEIVILMGGTLVNDLLCVLCAVVISIIFYSTFKEAIKIVLSRLKGRKS